MMRGAAKHGAATGLLLAAILLDAGGAAQAAAADAGKPSNEWSRLARPAAGAPQVIGGPASGCVVGAQPLPLDGPGYQVVRVSRNRFWAHPRTVAYIQNLARAAQGSGLATLYIGDMSQPRGGPMPFGHASHQNGLDVDVWFTLDPKPRLAPSQREDIPLPSLVSETDKRSVDPERWRPEHALLLRLAAERPEVERIFVNAAIKGHLCETTRGDRSWLRRIRPWRGHDEHFHVRLNCPGNDPQCVPGKPIPMGDGCDEVEEWLAPPPVQAAMALARPPAPPKPPRPAMPAACKALLAGR